MWPRPEQMRPTVAALAAVMIVAAAIALAARAAPVHYNVPPESVQPAPGPNAELVRTSCTICHSFDYVTTQPRGFADPTAFWTAEVSKMRTVYGAPIDPANIKPIVDYLVAVYGK